MTEHLNALVEGGSSDVRANGQAVWRSDVDAFTCIAHGAERVSTSGSESVFVNGHRAVRAGDFLVGSGLFNRITTGSPNVNIGTPGVGLAAPDSLMAYCKAYCALKKDWPKLSPKERKNRLQALVRDSFAQFGAPEPALTETAPKGTAGSFSPSKWELEVPPRTFDAAQPPPSEKLLHECRHGEQQFAPMREAASAVPDQAQGLAEASGVPLYVAQSAAQSPISGDTAYGRWARTMGEENLTATGRARQVAVIRGFYDATNKYGKGPEADAAYEFYRQLPNGEDADDIENQGTCEGCK